MTSGRKGLLAAMTPFVAFCGITAICSCTSDGSGDDTAEFGTDSISCIDSIVTPYAKAFCSIAVDYPSEGNGELVDSVREWIADQLSSTGYSSSEYHPYAAATTEVDNGMKLINTVCDTVLAETRREFASFDTLFAMNPDFSIEYQYNWDIRKIHETQKYITYMATTYAFLGGAHGGSSAIGQTFVADNGAALGLDMFRPSALPEVTALVKEGLEKFFIESGAGILRDALLINPDTLPLPATPPYLMADGVHFIYQQYEIAPYAAGMPGCVIPYSALDSCLTPAVASLVSPQAVNATDSIAR